MASMTIRKKWYEKLQQITDITTRNEALWAIVEYMASGSDRLINNMINTVDGCRDLMETVLNDIEKSRQRAEAARRRREERKQHAQREFNRPRNSKQHIYEQHPAMFLFDGFASYMMTTAYTAGRKVITEKHGNINFDKAINLFRKNVIERKQLGAIQRFQVFRDMFTRFVIENMRRIAVPAA